MRISWLSFGGSHISWPRGDIEVGSSTGVSSAADALGDASGKLGAPPAPVRVMMVNDHLGYAGGVIHGPARWFKNILPRFDPSRCQVELVILGMEHPFAAELARVGVRPLFLNRSKWDPRALLDLIGLLRRHRIDVLHVMGMKSIMLGRIAARYVGCKVVVHFHDTQRMAFPTRFVSRQLASWTDLALSCAPAVADVAEHEFAIPSEKSLVLLNAIPVHEFAQERPEGRKRVREELGIGPAARAIGMIGRLSPIKGPRACAAGDAGGGRTSPRREARRGRRR